MADERVPEWASVKWSGKGLMMMSNHMSSFVSGHEGKYWRASNPGMRGGVPEETDPKPFLIATNPRGESLDDMVQKSFLAIVKEGLHNDLAAYDLLRKSMGLPERRLSMEEVAASLVKDDALQEALKAALARKKEKEGAS